MHTKLRLGAREIFPLMRTRTVRPYLPSDSSALHYSLLTTHYSLLTTHYSLLTTTYYLLPPPSSLPKSMGKFAIRHDGIDALPCGGEGRGGEVEEAVEEVGALCLREVLPIGDGGAL